MSFLTGRDAKDFEAVEDAIPRRRNCDNRADGPDRRRQHRAAGSGRERAMGQLDILVLNAAMLGTLAPVPRSTARNRRVFTLNVRRSRR